MWHCKEKVSEISSQQELQEAWGEECWPLERATRGEREGALLTAAGIWLHLQSPGSLQVRVGVGLFHCSLLIAREKFQGGGAFVFVLVA